MTMFSRTLRFSALLALLVSVFFSTSCGEGGLASFTFTETSQEVKVAGSGLGGSCPPALGDLCFTEALRLNINLDQELEARDAGPADGVFLDELDLEITDTEQPSGDTDNFDFLDSLTIYANADGLERTQVAIIESVPDGRQTISLQTDDDVNLKPFIEAGMTLESEVEGRPPEDDTSLQAVTTIRVELL